MLAGCSCDQLWMMLADNFLWSNKIEWQIRILWCKNLLLVICIVYVIIWAMNLLRLCNYFFMLIFWQWTCFENLLAIILVGNCWALEICFVGSNWLGTCFVLNRQDRITGYVLARNVYGRKKLKKKSNTYSCVFMLKRSQNRLYSCVYLWKRSYRSQIKCSGNERWRSIAAFS